MTMPHVNSGGSEDFFSNDEVKVYKDEGEEEKRSSENLSEDKLGLVTETEEVRKNVDWNNYINGGITLWSYHMILQTSIEDILYKNKGVLFSLQGKNGSLGNGFDGGDKTENGREDGKITSQYTSSFDLC